MRNWFRSIPVAFALAALPALAFAQQLPQQPPQQPSQQEPDFGRFLYPPELIMQNQQRISLRPDQRTTITQAIQQLQSRVIELQWQMQSDAQKLTELMQASSIKEADALAQVDRVLGVERDIKRAHLSTLIRIKNTLSQSQQAGLDSARSLWDRLRKELEKP